MGQPKKTVLVAIMVGGKKVKSYVPEGLSPKLYAEIVVRDGLWDDDTLHAPGKIMSVEIRRER